MRALLVYPECPESFWSFKYALSFINKIRPSALGLLTVAALLPKDWEKKLVDMNVNPLRDEDLAWADYVFISAMVIQRKSVQEVVKRCKELGRKWWREGPFSPWKQRNSMTLIT